ncbi:hypothetical protein BaRGS_00007894 [Batillaria attramentaria]|uniref:Uncharacterized protein n=1 Tax=Batillaria attramentaria TaxID=370345 RepID=A0ABD0LNI6_9CAEN
MSEGYCHIENTTFHPYGHLFPTINALHRLCAGKKPDVFICTDGMYGRSETDTWRLKATTDTKLIIPRPSSVIETLPQATGRQGKSQTHPSVHKQISVLCFKVTWDTQQIVPSFQLASRDQEDGCFIAGVRKICPGLRPRCTEEDRRPAKPFAGFIIDAVHRTPHRL